MDQLIFAPLSHTHYWYEVGMLKVPAEYNVGELSLQPIMFPPKSFDNFPPPEGGCSEGLDAFRFFSNSGILPDMILLTLS